LLIDTISFVEFKLWRKTYDQVKTKLKTVEDKLRNIYGSPEKPKKKRNYALEKVYEPPSNNE
jgi:hypothetical protein